VFENNFMTVSFRDANELMTKKEVQPAASMELLQCPSHLLYQGVYLGQG
jgi:hypothetical protein